MKTFIALLCLLCIGFVTTSFQPAKWVSFAIDERMSVQLPAQPQEKDMASSPVKMYTTQDSVGTYVVMRTVLGKSFKGSQRTEYYDSLFKGFAESAKGEMIGPSVFTVAGFGGTDFSAKFNNPKTGQPMRVYVRCLLVDNVAYMLQFVPTDANGMRSQSQSKAFFSSMLLKPMPESAK